jgi:hypothetical protein
VLGTTALAGCVLIASSALALGKKGVSFGRSYESGRLHTVHSDVRRDDGRRRDRPGGAVGDVGRDIRHGGRGRRLSSLARELALARQ